MCTKRAAQHLYMRAHYPELDFFGTRFYAYLNETWQIITEFDSLDNLRAPVKSIWLGFMLERRRFFREIADMEKMSITLFKE